MGAEYCSLFLVRCFKLCLHLCLGPDLTVTVDVDRIVTIAPGREKCGDGCGSHGTGVERCSEYL
jgi:hypothetical protein